MSDLMHPRACARAIALAATLLSHLSACSDPLGTGDDERRLFVDPIGVVLPPGDAEQMGVTMVVGRTIYRSIPPQPRPWPADQPVIWTVSDPAVADVDAAGVLTARRVGTVVVRVRTGSLSDSTVVRVQPTSDPLTMRYVDVRAGATHSCGLSAEGAIYCWGTNSSGQLGIGRSTSYQAAVAPRRLASTLRFTTLAVGAMHTCALAADSTAYCWGDDLYDQLGADAGESATSPLPVRGGYRFRALDAGAAMTCGIAADATYCWGQVGARQHSAPHAVTSTRFTTLAVGGMHACGLTPDGEAHCWGRNDFGQVVPGGAGIVVDPVPVGGELRFASLAAGYVHTCGVTVAGEAHCWGNNVNGRAGGSGELAAIPVTRVRTAERLVGISAGASHTCAVTAARGALCWGMNMQGQLGDSIPLTTPNVVFVSPSPVTVRTNGRLFASVSAGAGNHTCARTIDGSALCWGYNESGQVGVGRRPRLPGTQLSVLLMPAAVVDPLY